MRRPSRTGSVLISVLTVLISVMGCQLGRDGAKIHEPSPVAAPSELSATATPAPPISSASNDVTSEKSPVSVNSPPPSAPVESADYLQYFQDPSYEAAEEYDFGTLVQGKVAEHTFKIVNSSDFPISFGEVRSDLACCLTSAPADSELGPGESTELKVRLESAYQGGAILATILVPITGQDVPLIYRFKGYVEEVLTAEPYVIKFGPKKKATVKIKSPRFATGLEVVRVEPDNPKIKAAMGQKTSSEQLVELDAAALNPGTAGFIKFLTSDKEVKDIYVQYQVESTR